jgi:hypothetical protein
VAHPQTLPELHPRQALGTGREQRRECPLRRWWPAIVVQWRRQDDGWVAQVAYVVDEAEGPAVLVVAWMTAQQLRPAWGNESSGDMGKFVECLLERPRLTEETDLANSSELCKDLAWPIFGAAIDRCDAPFLR